MKKSVLKKGDYEVTFVPSKGMNFVSLKKGEIEAIEQSTQDLFEERCAGLGAMIGPHFHRTIKDNPYSHGIGRYASWSVEEESETHIKAVLKGDDELEGKKLKDLEGQDFTMHYEARLTDEGLHIELAVQGETESVVGLHTYYALADGQGIVRARVRGEYNDQGEVKPMSSTWNYGADHTLEWDVSEPCDYGFRPYPDPLHGVMELETKSHGVKVQYWCDNEENSIQMWHPEGAPFVCMEPLSAKDPRKPRLTVCTVKILISVTPPSVI